jgi:hypothetical protein
LSAACTSSGYRCFDGLIRYAQEFGMRAHLLQFIFAQAA